MTCSVLPGTYGKVVQGMLALLTLATLGYKWSTDRSGRNRLQFLMDTFKNCSGAASLHFSNLMFAHFLAPVMKGADECHWYFIEIMIDTTFGVYVEFCLLMRIIDGLSSAGFTETATELSEHAAHADTGETAEGTDVESNDAPGQSSASWADIYWFKYFKQVVVWLLVVTLMKAVMVLIMLVEAPQLTAAAGFVLKPLDGNPRVELIIVMVVTPAIMNSLQFWLQDNIFVGAALKIAKEQKFQKYLDQQEERNSAAQAKMSKQSAKNKHLKQAQEDLEDSVGRLTEENEDLLQQNRMLQAQIKLRRGSVFMDDILAPVGSQLLNRPLKNQYMAMDLSKDSKKQPAMSKAWSST